MNHPLIRALAQLVEKAGWTAAQVFLTPGGSATAGGASVCACLTSTSSTPEPHPWRNPTMNHPLIRALAQLVEKAGWTAAQVFLGVIITAGALDATAAQAAAVAAFAAVFTLLANGLPQPVGEMSFGVDLLYRTTRTFGSGFFALIAAIPLTDLSVDGVKAAAVAAIPAALTILKGAIASKVGAPTPATLPATLDTVDTTTPGFFGA